jgi:hypothetical protein
MQYENKVETIVGTHSQNLLGENSSKGFKKIVLKILLVDKCNMCWNAWSNSQMKVQGPCLVHSFIRKMKKNHLIQDVEW